MAGSCRGYKPLLRSGAVYGGAHAMHRHHQQREKLTTTPSVSPRDYGGLRILLFTGFVCGGLALLIAPSVIAQSNDLETSSDVKSVKKPRVPARFGASVPAAQSKRSQTSKPLSSQQAATPNSPVPRSGEWFNRFPEIGKTLSADQAKAPGSNNDGSVILSALEARRLYELLNSDSDSQAGNEPTKLPASQRERTFGYIKHFENSGVKEYVRTEKKWDPNQPQKAVVRAAAKLVGSVGSETNAPSKRSPLTKGSDEDLKQAVHESSAKATDWWSTIGVQFQTPVTEENSEDSEFLGLSETLAPEVQAPLESLVESSIELVNDESGSDSDEPGLNEDRSEPIPDSLQHLNSPVPIEVIDHSDEIIVILRRSKLLRISADIVRTAVVDPAVCDIVQFTPREITIIGKMQGATHVTFWFDDGEQRPVTYLVRVLPDPEIRKIQENHFAILEEVISKLFPDSSVELIAVANKLIIRGQAKGAEQAAQIMHIVRGEMVTQSSRFQEGNPGGLGEGDAAEVLSGVDFGRRLGPNIQIINMLRIPGPQQVALRVKIAELNRSAARGIGVDLEAQFRFSSKNGAAIFLETMLNAAKGNAPALLTELDGDDINIGIRWLEERGVVRLLSEPTLVTLSGHPATFVAGGEFAVPTTVGVSGVAAVTTDFRSFGAIISFLPVVLDKDRIRLEISPEFSQINSNLTVQNTPGLDVRAVTTTVEMREGQTLAIAGLLDDSMTASRKGNIPLISQLLSRRDVHRNETELIILVTPELVHPMEPEDVPPVPGYGVDEPNNLEFYLGGRLEGKSRREFRGTVWPNLRRRYRTDEGSWVSGPFGHSQ